RYAQFVAFDQPAQRPGHDEVAHQDDAPDQCLLSEGGDQLSACKGQVGQRDQ
nr:hypothetical protein [Tanacetum cinerariifolium]